MSPQKVRAHLSERVDDKALAGCVQTRRMVMGESDYRERGLRIKVVLRQRLTGTRGKTGTGIRARLCTLSRREVLTHCGRVSVSFAQILPVIATRCSIRTGAPTSN
jgi:hypothetical protein